MRRVVQPERLDDLPATDVRALRSRRDLRRINAWMANARTMAGALLRIFAGDPFQRITDLGAGDGEFLCQVAKRMYLRGRHSPTCAVLVDRRNLLRSATCAALEQLNWSCRCVAADALGYLRDEPPRTDVIVTNLFLHHLRDDILGELLAQAARCAPVFVAVEPRRESAPLLFSRMLWAIGCNAVTRYDAPISVRAGFTGQELSALWPRRPGWELTERRAGLFGHFFMARRIG